MILFAIKGLLVFFAICLLAGAIGFVFSLAFMVWSAHDLKKWAEEDGEDSCE